MQTLHMEASYSCSNQSIINHLLLMIGHTTDCSTPIHKCSPPRSSESGGVAQPFSLFSPLKHSFLPSDLIKLPCSSFGRTYWPPSFFFLQVYVQSQIVVGNRMRKSNQVLFFIHSSSLHLFMPLKSSIGHKAQ